MREDTGSIDKRYLEREACGLKYGIVEVTTQCQLRCPGCYMVRRNALKATQMTLQEAVRVLDLCREYRGSELETMDILGGEPLLWEPLQEYITELLKRNIKPWIFTNMLAITPEMAQWLWERQVHITGKLNISDPKDPEQLMLQAKMIGATTTVAKKMLAAIETFVAAGYRDPLFRLQNLIRKENISLVPDYIRFCQAQGVGFDLELMSSGEPVGPEYFRIAPTPQELAEMIHALKDAFPDLAKDFLMPHVFGSCPFYDKGLYFAVDGHIRSCTNSTTILAYVTDQDPVKKAYESPLICSRLKLTKELVGEPCHTCERWEKCRGGCRATVEGLGDPFGGYSLCPLPLLK